MIAGHCRSFVLALAAVCAMAVGSLSGACGSSSGSTTGDGEGGGINGDCNPTIEPLCQSDVDCIYQGECCLTDSNGGCMAVCEPCCLYYVNMVGVQQLKCQAVSLDGG